MSEKNCSNIECDSYNEQVMDNCAAYATGKLKEMCGEFMPEKAEIIYPWDKYIKETDGNFKDFSAWEKWLNDTDEFILEDMEIESRSSLYATMIDLVKGGAEWRNPMSVNPESREKKFTKGPWKVRLRPEISNLAEIVSERSNWFVAEEILKCDANLIAAAPDLLKELESHCRACMKRNNFENGCSGCFTQRAIAKAHGGIQ